MITMTTDRSQFADDWTRAVLTRPGWGVSHVQEYLIASGIRNDLWDEENATDEDAPETVEDSAIYALCFFGRTMLHWFALVGGGAVFHVPDAVALPLAALITGLGIVSVLWEEARELWA
ncbi:MAG: hypothetical protein WCJ55_19180 [Chloroflexales bacterium]